MGSDSRAARSAALTDALIEAVGPERVTATAEERELASQDVYRGGVPPQAVVAPGTTAEVQAVLRVCHEHRVATFTRGGGMSYTDAYLPNRENAIVLDMSGLNAVREIHPRDLYATVDAGCTWAALDAALAEYGLRSVFWGPMSGSVATVGGGMAQGALTFGSGRHGTSVSAALGLEVVLADGSLLVTGSGGQPGHSRFFREYGPDLTGLFCADAGALGVKTAVTLKLEPRPAAGEGLSFAFNDFSDLVEVVRKVARCGAATEVFGTETELLRQAAGESGLQQDAAKLLTILRGASNPLQALRTGLRVVVGGRRFLSASKYLAHFLCEGADSQELRMHLRRIRQAVGGAGVEVANTAAEFLRADPFPEPMVVSPDGRRLLPLHAIVPFSGAEALHEEYLQYMQGVRGECREKGVQAFIVYSVSGSGGFLYEVVIYWQDEWLAFHHHHLAEALQKTAREPSPNPEGRALVERIRVALIELMYKHGAAHLQIGRAYPYARDRNTAAIDVLKSVKQQVDPLGLINPGALGI
ncbi:FAD-binding oxidoreductase [Candidatus Foliamicus sp.]